MSAENRAETAPTYGRDLQLLRQRDENGGFVGFLFIDHAAHRLSIMYPTRTAALDAWTNRTIEWRDFT